MIKLNLGASDDAKPGFLSVDIAPPADVVCDLRERWPWSDGEVEAIYAKDVAEHMGSGYRLKKTFVNIPIVTFCTNGFPDYGKHIKVLSDVELVPYNGMIHFMNEAHRVLRPGGLIEIIVPCFPGEASFCDPTHGWPIWTKSTRYYFDERWNNPEGERGRLGPTMAQGVTALFRTVGGASGPDWTPIAYAPDAPERRKLFLILSAVK